MEERHDIINRAKKKEEVITGVLKEDFLNKDRNSYSPERRGIQAKLLLEGIIFKI